MSQREGRHRALLSSGLLRAQVVHSRAGWCRIALVATTALLLGGDRVQLDVEVGPGVRLELFEVTGTVAYDGHGRGADWGVRADIATGAVLHLNSQPFVVADGARVTRHLELDLAAGAAALLRDTVVLGRHGQSGGWLRNSTAVRVGGRLVLMEDQELDPSWRRLSGMLRDFRVLDTIMALGGRPAVPDGGDAATGVAQFLLTGGSGVLRRYLGLELAESPLHQEWDRLRADTDAVGAKPPGAGAAIPR